MESSAWLIICGAVHLLERKGRHSLALRRFSGTQIQHHGVSAFCTPTCMHHGQGSTGLLAERQRQRGRHRCHVVGICSFINMNSAHSLEKQGSETLFKIQNGERGRIMRGFGYRLGSLGGYALTRRLYTYASSRDGQ